MSRNRILTITPKGNHSWQPCRYCGKSFKVGDTILVTKTVSPYRSKTKWCCLSCAIAFNLIEREESPLAV